MPSSTFTANAILRGADPFWTHRFVNTHGTDADATLTDGDDWNGGHILVNPRLLYSDLCATSSLPSGGSSSGDLAFDSTRLRRELGGTQNSTYTTPSFALNGPLICEVEVEHLNNFTTGASILRVIRDTGSTLMGRIESQSADGNNVITIDGSARWASGTTTAAATYVRDDPEQAHRRVIHVTEQKLISIYDHAPVGGVPNTGGTYTNSGKHPSGAVQFIYTGTLSAGDLVHFELQANTTRKDAIYLVRIWRGAIAP